MGSSKNVGNEYDEMNAEKPPHTCQPISITGYSGVHSAFRQANNGDARAQ